MPWTKGQKKFVAKPTPLNIPAELEQSKIYGGSLFTMLEVTDSKDEGEALADGETVPPAEGQESNVSGAAAATA